MKKMLFAAISLTTLLYSCGSNKEGTTNTTTGTDSATLSEDTSGGRMNATDNTTAKMSDTTGKNMSSGKTVADPAVISFVNKAASVGMMEIELGNYAAANAQSNAIKDFGKMLVTDHTDAGNKLKSMATADNITVSSTMQPAEQEHVDMLKKMKGAAFDKAYIDMMVNGHQETINMFKKASADLPVDSYKSFATMTLPVLQKHLDAAKAIQKK